MIKQEINELKRLYTPANCSITRICGCYVDHEKEKKAELKKARAHCEVQAGRQNENNHWRTPQVVVYDDIDDRQDIHRLLLC